MSEISKNIIKFGILGAVVGGAFLGFKIENTHSNPTNSENCSTNSQTGETTCTVPYSYESPETAETDVSYEESTAEPQSRAKHEKTTVKALSHIAYDGKNENTL